MHIKSAIMLLSVSCGVVSCVADGDAPLQALVELRSDDGICPAGGTKVVTGQDRNRDGVLGDEEVTSTTVICKGEKGADGYCQQDAREAFARVATGGGATNHKVWAP